MDTPTSQAPAERRPFEAEVSRLLEIVAHSLYSERRVFLRELVSNAADACDRLRYESLQNPGLMAEDAAAKIVLRVDKETGTLTVSDNGIGMGRDELVSHLGTIARSGTAAFAGALGSAQNADAKMIGQFGVGFYSAFMVADRVAVVSRRAGSDEAWLWSSDGKTEFSVAPTTRDRRGTDVILHLKQDAREFLEPQTLRGIVRDYADHIGVPVVLAGSPRDETLNQAAALWTRPRSELSEQQYAEFFRHLARRWDAPWATVHWKAEGVLEYSGLVYVPAESSYDIWHPDRRHGVRLYVRRVFITDRADELVPRWLRFLVGVVDSADLPLNVSREMLQNNPVVRKIGQGVITKVLAELERRTREPDDYAKFWEAFGPVLKEGLVTDPEHRDKLMALMRFRSTARDGWVSLAQYLARMKEGQHAIYYVTGEDQKTLRALPQLEGYLKRGVEVLLLSDAVDDFWLQHVHEHQGRPFRSVTRGADDLAGIDLLEPHSSPPPASGELDGLVAFLRVTLDAEVKDVRLSHRLEGSAACLVADDRELDIHLERLLRQHRQLESVGKRILEINPRHALVKAMADALRAPGGNDKVADAARLLVDQSRLVAGDPVPDPVAFARRLEAALQRGLPTR